MRIFVISTLLHLAASALVVPPSCPDLCHCQNTKTVCSSYEFIKSLTPLQMKTMKRLEIADVGLEHIDDKLQYLKSLDELNLSRNSIGSLPDPFPYLPKLKSLNFSHNHIKEVQFAKLPAKLEHLDLSNNKLMKLPKDHATLKHLKTLRLAGNPIDCNCSNLIIYSELLQSGVSLRDEPKCFQPKEFSGRSLDSVNCSMITSNLLNNLMINDEASGEHPLDTVFGEDTATIDEREGFMAAEDLDKSPNELDEGEVGSGDGLIPIIPFDDKVSPPKACHFNCSTPKPIGSEDEKDASDPPGFGEQIKTFFADVFGLENDASPTSTTTATPTTPAAASSEQPVEKLREKEEAEVIKESDKSEVETFHSNHKGGEMERASVGSQNYNLYIIVGLVVAFVTLSTLYYVNKKRSKNSYRTNKPEENGIGEEMKPLGKSSENGGGENGLPKPKNEEEPLLREPELVNGRPIDDYIETRMPNFRKLSQPEKVIIKETELTDAIPKTPVFVHREINSAGEIVTTAVVCK